jgi:GR25 family glycosyltransferase involved in LPS biosynthesis
MDKNMSSLNNYFQEIQCINLERRSDRWKECLEEFNKYNLIVNRYEAFDGENLNELSGLNRGQVGAIYSHRGVIQYAKNNKLDNILILEDDVKFDESLNQKFSVISHNIPDDWDVILFGGNHVANNPWAKGTLTFVADNIFKVTYSLALHAYAIKNTVYDKAIETLSKMNNTNDALFAEIQEDINCYIIRPHLAWQRPSYSDLCGIYSDHIALYDDNALFEGKFFGDEAIKRDDIYDKLDPTWKTFWDNQKQIIKDKK